MEGSGGAGNKSDEDEEEEYSFILTSIANLASMIWN